MPWLQRAIRVRVYDSRVVGSAASSPVPSRFRRRAAVERSMRARRWSRVYRIVGDLSQGRLRRGDTERTQRHPDDFYLNQPVSVCSLCRSVAM